MFPGGPAARHGIVEGSDDKQTLVCYTYDMAVTEHVARREQLVDNAAQLFSERGYHGTSMADLANSMGILRGSLYAHIDSKEQLLFDIVDRGADRFITRLEETVASDDGPERKLRRAISAHIETVAEHMDASTVFLSEWRYLTGEAFTTIMAKRDLYESLWVEIIEEGIEWGVFPEGLDPAMATRMVLGAINWLYQWYDPQGEVAPDRVALQFDEMIQSGLRSRNEEAT